MGIRMTQFQGLSEGAMKWLKENCKSRNLLTETKVYDEDTGELVEEKVDRFSQLILEKTGKKAIGMFPEDEYQLNRYITHHGVIIEEFVQAEPWSSGPVIFLALRVPEDFGGQVVEESLWPQEEIETC